MIVGFGAMNIKACNINKPIEIKPITILMGENSSGKSSFLQAMSLLSMNKILGNDIKRIKYNNPFHKLGRIDEFKSKDNHVDLFFKFKDKKENSYNVYFLYNNDTKSDDYGYLSGIFIKYKETLTITYRNDKYFISLESLITEDNREYFSKTIIEESQEIWFKTEFKSLQLDSYPKVIEVEVIKHLEEFKKLEEPLKDIFQVLEDNISAIKHISRVKEIITHYNYSSDYIGYNGEKYKDIAKDLKDIDFLEKAIKNIFNYKLDKIDEYGNCYLNQKITVEIWKNNENNKFYFNLDDLLQNINYLDIKEIELKKIKEVDDFILYQYYENKSLGLNMFGSSVSNIIPTLTQFAKNRETPEKYNITIVEEPELGLHPQAQAKFVETLFGMDDYYKTQTTILETHSEHIVNKLRYLVYKGKVEPEEVVIYYKTKDKDEFDKIEIDKKGMFKTELENNEFPQGFYDATLDEMFEIETNAL